MSGSSKNLLSVLGAGYTGALLYQNQDLVGEIGKSVLRTAVVGPPSSVSSSRGAVDYESLARLVKELEKSVQSLGSRASVTVVQGSGSGRPSLALIGSVLAVGAGGALYLKLRGFTADDLVYVTRTGFKHGVCAVMSQMLRVKDFLSGRIDQLSGRVEEGLAQQGAIAADVADMQQSLALLTEGMGDVRGALEGVDGRLDSLHSKQEFACRGIYLLCSVVSDATSKDRHLDTAALREFTQQPPLAAAAPAPAPLPAGLAAARKQPLGGPADLPALAQQRASLSAAAGLRAASPGAALSPADAAAALPQRPAKAPLQAPAQFFSGGAAASSEASLDSVLAAIQQMAQQHLQAPAGAGAAAGGGAAP